MKTYFDVNNAGSVTGGTLNICAGGSNPNGCADDSTNYKIVFNGTTTNGVFNASITSATVEPPFSSPQSLTTITGELEGLFTRIVSESTEELYDAFVGGFNFGDSGDPSKFLSGTFVVEREDRLTASEIGALTQAAVLVNNASGNTGFFRTNSNADYFVGNSNVVKFDELSYEYDWNKDLDGFSFTWASWESAEVLADNLIYGRTAVDPVQVEPLWWVTSDWVKPPQNLTGTYRTILNQDTTPQQLSFLGGDGEFGDLLGITFNDIYQLEIEFDVDLNSGITSNGIFEARTDNSETPNIWKLHDGFGGEIQGSMLVFNNFVDNGTNDFGDYTPDGGAPAVIDQVSMSGIFINKTSSSFNGEGVAGGFALEAGNTFLNGLYLAGIEDVEFIDLRLEGLDPLETDEYNPVNNGLVMIGDWSGWDSDFSPVYSGIVAFDEASPVFLTNWDGIPYTVFKQDNATGANTFPLSSTYPGVQWGIWDMQAEEIGPTAYYDLAAESFDNFNFLPWLVVPALDPSTEITTYTGSMNYGFTRASMARNNWEGTLSALNVSMDVDFTYGNIYDGTINLCFGGTGCASSEESWHGHFSGGSINQGVINPMWVYGSVSNGWDFEGEIGGFLTGYNAPPNDYPNPPPYDALVGGFNLAEGNCGEGCSSYTGRTVSGTFLSEPEMRLSASDMYYVDGHVRGALMKPDGTVLTGLVGTHNASYPSSVFFIDESTPNDTVWQLGSFADTNHIHAVQYGGNCDGSCDVQLGIWNGDATLYDDNIDISSPGTITGPIAWLNYEPVDFSGVGFTRYGDESAYARVSFNSDEPTFTDINPGIGLNVFNFEFDTDFSTGLIEDTTMVVKQTEVVQGTTLDFVWTLNFSPDNTIQDGIGFFNTEDFTGGTLTVWNGSIQEDSVAIDKAILSGAFSYSESDLDNEAYVVGSLLIEADFTFGGFNIDARVVGEYESYGYVEERLSRNEMLAMNDNLGLLVKRSGTTSSVEEHFLTTGNNSNMRFADTTLTDAQLTTSVIETNTDDNIHATLFGPNPLNIIEENGGPTAATNTTPGFNVGWGLWDGGVDIIDAQGVASVYTADAYWLSAQRAGIADLTGAWSYSNVIDHDGSGSHGSLDTLDMGFDVNFGTGQITAGFFDANVGATTWSTEFTGTVHGPVANINDFANSTITGLSAPSISGEIRGIFTGTGANQGFATGFSLHEVGGDYLNGVGLLGTRTVIGVD